MVINQAEQRRLNHRGTRWPNLIFLLLITVLITLHPRCTTATTQNPQATTSEPHAGQHAASMETTLTLITDTDPRRRSTKELELTFIEDVADDDGEEEDDPLMMGQTRVLRVLVTLRCAHPSIRYSLRFTTGNSDVVTVESWRRYNISCVDAVLEEQGHDGGGDHVGGAGSENNPDLTNLIDGGVAGGERDGGRRRKRKEAGVQRGEGAGLDSLPVVRSFLNVTLRTDLLGRTWLLAMGARWADPGVSLPDFLVLAWQQQQHPLSQSPGQQGDSPYDPYSPATLADTSSSSSSSSPQEVNSSRNDRTSDSSPGSETSDAKAASDESSNDVTGSKKLSSGGSNDVTYSVEAASGDVRGTGSDDADRNGVTEHELHRHVVSVLRKIRPVDRAFRLILYSFVILNTIGMGCKTDPAVVKDTLKRPVAPAIGFFCQYLFMPLIAFMVSKTMTVGDPAVSLGIFACGICPGGGASNMFCYLLDGDVSLSVTLTAVSSISALAMIPLWMFTLGETYQDDKISLNIPFGRILMTLAIIIIPLFIGVAIKRFLPKVCKWILKILKPFTLVAILFLLTLGIYSNLYVFRLFSPRTIAAGCMLPYIGYVLGTVTSLVLCRPAKHVRTIAIETGIQNTNIAYLILIFSLPAPDGDMAAVGPMASAIMTPLPLLLIAIVYLLYKRFCRKKKDEGEDEGEEGKEKDKEEMALKEKDDTQNNGGDLEEMKCAEKTKEQVDGVKVEDQTSQLMLSAQPTKEKVDPEKASLVEHSSGDVPDT